MRQGVIDLNGYLELQGRERNYTVSVSDLDANGDYTVTVTPKNGFDITGIGAIYVEGVKMAVSEVDNGQHTYGDGAAGREQNGVVGSQGAYPIDHPGQRQHHSALHYSQNV